MRINKDRLISEFTKLVSIDSRSFNEKEVAKYLKQRLISLGFSVFEDEAGKYLNGNCGNIYGFKAGDSSLEPLLFSAHMDTVEPSINKKAVIGEDGVIRSNGDTVLGADDCSGLASILEALQTIEDNNLPHHPIEVLFTIAEEVYCKGATQFDFARIKSKEAYVLDLTGSVGTAAYKSPTILSFTITVNGKSAHAGFAPENGIHSIKAAADAISKINMGHVDDETTLNIGTIEGGLGTNIIPNNCVVKGEVRSYSHLKALKFSEAIQKQFMDSASAIGALVDFHSEIHCEAYETPIDNPVVKRFMKACHEQQLPTTLVKTFGGSDNNLLAKHGIKGIVIANAMNQCHSCEEYTTVEELCNIAELTTALMIPQ